jgi:hypothetical protein
MAKGRSQRGREEKKPKASKKPTQTSATFLRPAKAVAPAAKAASKDE